MSKIYKLVFAGPVGAGKTTAIRSLSDIEVVSTEAKASDDTQLLKPTTTVAMDYGLMRLDSGDQVRLYGTPGQQRFDFMWDILSENALGLVLLINASAPDPDADLRLYASAFQRLIADTSFVVALTHGEEAGWHIRDNLANTLISLGLPPIIMDTDARSREHMRAVVQALIYSIDPYTTEPEHE